ncbi:MAG: ATP-dependent Clp protease ATP-binding subunit [Treponema sp.]|nr:ATP-dependent Clp protease ATP-binding subunit [Treponema sp.]
MKTFSPRSKKILGALAQDEARKYGSKQIYPEHVILAIMNLRDCLARFAIVSLLKDAELITKFNNELKYLFESENSLPTLDEIPKSRRFEVMLDLADIESTALHNDYIGTEHLLLAAMREEGGFVSSFFQRYNIKIMDVRFLVMDLQNKNLSSIQQFSAESALDSIFKSIFDSSHGIFDSLDEEKEEKKKTEEEQSFLTEYSRDLTKMAREKKSDPVVGRSKEIQRIIQILSRRTKNNPVLTGEPGVGKTAIIEGLAQHIVDGLVPNDLLNKRILSLDLAALVAGTKYRGEFEERMKKMLKELKENKDIILFIDELHTIIGAGGNEGTMDASNIMKPALSRGEIQIIGATTTKEYTKHIEKDLALERRFQIVKVEEPTDAETEEILNGIKKKYESYHRVIYEDNVIPSIVKLSRRYIPEKVLPDKAIDILDEAGAAKKIQEESRPSEFLEIEERIAELTEEKTNLVNHQDYENAALVRDKVIELRHQLENYSNRWMQTNGNQRKIVTCNDVEKIISNMTGIPVEQMTSSESQRILNMENELHNTVIGQENAVNIISGAVRRSRAGISSPKHPVGSFLFLGPTGVGKTQLAKALAKYLFGTEESLIRIDMSDFMEKHTASRLVGAPPGYIGYQEGGVLTEKVRRNPYSVVLLDEIEKAHPDIFNLLLQVLEEGELSDNIGHTVNFRNTIIIMTSNAGARQITNEGRVGFGFNTVDVLPYEEIKSTAMNELKKLLSPELLNRIDDVIVFDALKKDEVSKILDIQIADLASRLNEKDLKIEITPKAKEYLIQNGYNPSMGARPMKRLLRKEVEDPLSTEILANYGKKYNFVRISCKNDKINVELLNKDIEMENITTKVQVSNSLNK